MPLKRMRSQVEHYESFQTSVKRNMTAAAAPASAAFPQPSNGALIRSRMTSSTITLDAQEQLFVSFLLQYRDKHAAGTSSEPTVLRFAGGWVRDKLLGVKSHDIDVALSNMTGSEFGREMQKFVEQPEVSACYTPQAEALGITKPFRSLHTIAANPEKSKHLETSTTNIFGLDADFVNLRKEVYDAGSRNPQMEFGTPEEDALRRDATINALFYNLDTQQIEDFTEKGLDDMRDQIIRTPLEPYQTFSDDPLRVLRLIRFASRLGWNIDGECYTFMQEKSIHRELARKISRERVNVEFMKMLNGPDPKGALMTIQDANLWPIVFALPSDLDYQSSSVVAKSVPSDAITNLPTAYDTLHTLITNAADPTSVESVILELADQQSQVTAWFLAAYVPYVSLGAVNAELAAREGIKATSHQSKLLKTSVENYQKIHDLVQTFSQDQNHGGLTRGKIGLLLHKLGAHVLSWRLQIVYALLCDSTQGVQITKYRSLLEYIKKEDIHSSVEKALSKDGKILNGKRISELLDAKPGKWTKVAEDMVFEWQFENPEGTREEAKKWMTNNKDKIRQELGLND